MALLNVIKWDEDILRQKTVDVDLPPTPELKKLAFDMIQTMETLNGVGLSTPQINRTEKMFVMRMKNTMAIVINPVIRRVGEKVVSHEEGCLSLPGVTVNVPRPKFIWVDYYDAAGRLHSNVKLAKVEARIFQHEFDHLKGVLIVDYVKDEITAYPELSSVHDSHI